MPPVKLTTETQTYVRSIANESYRGEPDEIVGYITRLYPNRLLAEIKIKPARYVKVGLSEENFDFVRYKTVAEQQLRFKGRPVVHLGKDLSTFQEFEAESVEIHEA
jgi:hypothetical protein